MCLQKHVCDKDKQCCQEVLVRWCPKGPNSKADRQGGSQGCAARLLGRVGCPASLFRAVRLGCMVWLSGRGRPPGRPAGGRTKNFRRVAKSNAATLQPYFGHALGIGHPAFERVLLYWQTEPSGKHRGVNCSRGVSRLNPTHPRRWADI